MNNLSSIEIKEELLKLGVQPQLRAFEWLARAIQICSEDKKIRENPVGQIYSQLSEEYSTESDLILQAIRRIVKSTWEDRNNSYQFKDNFNKIFGYRQEQEKAPSSLEFITRMSDYLTRKKGNNV